MTTEIADQITSIQTASDETVVAIRNVVDAIGEIDEIGTAIAAAIEEQSTATKEISRSVQEAARRTQDVNSNIAGVRTRRQRGWQRGESRAESGCSICLLQSNDLTAKVDRFLAEGTSSLSRNDGFRPAPMPTDGWRRRAKAS